LLPLLLLGLAVVCSSPLYQGHIILTHAAGITVVAATVAAVGWLLCLLSLRARV
jgi:hypothetical protein